MSSTDTKQLIKMYRDYRLSEPFAMAIVEGKDPKAVMEFWNQDWHKQYPDADDVLVIAVLEQNITPEEGEWLNSVRSNHEAMVLSCLDGSCTIEWAKSLMDAGFLNHSKEVNDILKGGDPVVIGVLSGIELESDLLPPRLEINTKTDDFLSNSMDHLFGDHSVVSIPKANKQDLEIVSPDASEKFAHIECSNCKALVATSVTTCPHCKFQLVWDWDLLRDDEKSYIRFFMTHYLPGMAYQNNLVVAFLKLLSSLEDLIYYDDFWNIVKSEHFYDIGRIPHSINSLLIDQLSQHSHRDIPALRGQAFDKDAWIQLMVHASKFWGRI